MKVKGYGNLKVEKEYKGGLFINMVLTLIINIIKCIY